MITHNLLQGSPQWLAYRFEHYNASEAAAMLGLSKTTTRTELMHMMHTGLGKEFSDWVQLNVLDRGHEVEAKVRPLVETMIADDLYPVTCSEGRLSASLDGLTMCGEIAFECKQWNAEIAQQVAAGEMPEQHMPQCQQIMMVTGAKKVVFAVGDGTPENLLTLDVYPDPQWFKRIEAGWAQFAIDLDNYVPAVVEVKPVGATPETLPALRVEVTGMVTASNLAEYKEHALSVIGAIKRDIQTDQDFANAAKAVKWCGDVESRLEAVKQHALSQTETIDVLFKTIDDIKAKAKETRLELDKLVTRRNTERKEEIILGGKSAYQTHLDGLKAETEGLWVVLPTPDFAGAVKGMRLLANMQDAVNTLLANSKIAADDSAKKIRANLALLKEDGKGFEFLFNDRANLIGKAADDLKLLIRSRIADHHASEAAKEEATRERIRAEEQAKAEREAREKVAAELAAAKASEGAELSPAAQAQNETEGADRFTKAHPSADGYVTHAQVVATVRAAVAPKPTTPPSMALGEISTRLGFNCTSAFLATLGFEATTVKAAKLFHEADFPAICRALINHIANVCQQQEA